MPPPTVTPAADPRFVQVRREDGAEWILPTETAARIGLWQPEAQTAPGPAAPVAPAAPSPTPEPPRMSQTPARTADVLPRGLASQIGLAPAEPAAPAPTFAERATEALMRNAGEQFYGAAPAQAPAAPGQPRRRAPAPEAPPPDPNASLVDALTQRPSGDAPIVPGDMRSTSPLEAQLQGIDDGRRIAQETERAQAVAAAERQDVLARAQADAARLEAERMAAMNAATRRYEAAVEEARQARVDPTRFYRDRGAAGTIGVAIATALGGIGAAISGGGPNQALATIERAIDRDIAAQESNQRNAQSTAGLSRSFLDITRQQFADRQAAADAAKSLAWANVAERAEAQAAQLREQGAALRARELAAEAQARSQAAARAAIEAQQTRELDMMQRQLELRRLGAQTVREERRAMGGGAGAGAAGLQAPPSGWQGTAEQWAALPLSDRRQVVRSLGTRETAPDQQQGAINALETALDRVQALIPDEGDIPGFGTVDSALPGFAAGSEARRLRQEVRALVDTYGRLRSGGAIGEEEAANFDRIIGAGAWQTEEELRNGLRLLRDEIRARRGERPAGPQTTAAAPALPPGVRPR